MMARINNDLNNQLDDLKDLLEKLRESKDALEEELKSTEIYVKSDMDVMSMDELREYERMLVELRGNAGEHMGRFMMINNNEFVPSMNGVVVGHRGGVGARGAMCYDPYENNAFFESKKIVV